MYFTVCPRFDFLYRDLALYELLQWLNGECYKIKETPHLLKYIIHLFTDSLPVYIIICSFCSSSNNGAKLSRNGFSFKKKLFGALW